jgi:hypothetical protein
LGESLYHRVGAGGRSCVGGCIRCGGIWTCGRKILRQCGEIGLRLRQIPGLQILPQLLKFSPDLLESGRRILGALRIRSRARGKQIAAKDANDGHFCTSSQNLRTKSDLPVVRAGLKFCIGKSLRHFSRPDIRQSVTRYGASGMPKLQA